MEPKIVKTDITTYKMNLTELEILALYLFIGGSSFSDRKKIGIPDDENDALSKLYGDINAAINE
jgi:hypothetical protein